MGTAGIIRAAILGAGGFTGQELLRLFASRDDVSIELVTSNEYAGKRLSQVFPQLQTNRYLSLVFSRHPDTADDLPEVDIVFLAVPDEAALHWAPLLLERNIRVIDISGSFRLQDPTQFQTYYKLEHSHPHLLKEAVYGLCELNREQIKGARLLANPGCYPTSITIPLLAMKEYLNIFSPRLVIDAKSGTSGAGGRKEKDSLGYSTVYENFRAYRIEGHQHTPEIEQTAALLFGCPITARFTPHLLPMFRGILSNTYLFCNDGTIDFIKLQQAADGFAEQEPFVRYYRDPNKIELKNVQQTNFVDFSLYYDERNRIVQVISATDNLGKGAAGQAIQNMNLMFSKKETEGLL